MMELLANVDVDDLEKAIGFYRDGLGLHVGRRFGDGGVEMLGASSPIYLLVKAAGSAAYAGSAQVREYRRHWTPVHLDFVVDEIHAAVRAAVAAGAQMEEDVQTHKWGRIAHLAD